MLFNRRLKRNTIPIIEMTSMIDIIFLLIIFFMVAARFAQLSTVELNLPQEVGEIDSLETPSTLIINITSNGEIILDSPENVISISQLDLRLKKFIKDKNNSWQSISLRADKNATSDTLNKILKLLNKYGLTSTRIATQSP